MNSPSKPNHDWSVGRAARWKRRAITIPGILIGAIVIWALSPVVLVVALIADLLEGWTRRRWLRVFAFVFGFVTLEFVVVWFGLVLWFATGFCRAVHRPWSQAAHHWVKLFWSGWVLRLVRVCMSTKVSYDGDEVVVPGPLVTVARHVSMFDAVVPVIVLGTRHGLRMRYTLKNDLVWVPSLDVFGHRLPTYFVERRPADRDRELDPIRTLAMGIDESSSGVVFPEGTFRTEERFARALDRIAETDPARAERVATLRHMLPVRSGGTLAMLEGAPTADVAVIAHVGFENFHSFKHILANIPFERDIEIGVWRIDRSEVPDDTALRRVWLDEQWQLVDDWVEARLG